MPTDKARAEAIHKAAAEEFAYWLSQHPLTLQELIHDAVKAATKEWLDRNGPDLFDKEN